MELNFDHLTRQLDLLPVEKLGKKVTIIGAGAIGSFLGLSLAKMGLTRLTVFDHDDVSIENMSNQFYRFTDIGTNKANSLMETIRAFTGVRITAHARKFVESDAAGLQGIVVVAVDSMEARKMIYEAIKKSGFQVELIIDPRMSAEFYQQYAMKPFDESDQKTYEKTLFTDEDAEPARCTAKSTIYTATLAAGVVVKTIKNWIMEQPYPRNLSWNIAGVENAMVAHPGNVQAP